MTDESQPARPGWYPDPDGSGTLRWWSGSTWYEDTLTELPSVEETRKRLRDWDWFKDLATHHQLLRIAVGLGPAGTELLAAEFVRRTEFDRVPIAAALGDCVGENGIPELRAAFKQTGPGTVDLRCASLAALAKRCGVAATPDLIVGLQDRNGAVKDVAVLWLARVGDSSAWEPAIEQLSRWLKKPTKFAYAPVDPRVALVCFLLVHGNSQQTEELSTLIHSAWPRLSPSVQSDISTLWPAMPDSPRRAEGSPDAAAVRSWLSQRMVDWIPSTD